MAARVQREDFDLGAEVSRLRAGRTDVGAVDVNATAQLLNDVVERWVRAEPGQWMWFHKRWSLSPFARGIKK